MRYIPYLVVFVCCLFTADLMAQCTSGDCVNGKGVYEFSNGAKYEGSFKDGMRHGLGTFYYPNGNVYSGIWAFRFPDGEGAMSYPDGTSDTGYWKKGNFLGEQPPVVEEEIVEVVKTQPTQEFTSKGTDPGVKQYGESVYEVGKKIERSSVEGTKMYAVVVGISDYTIMPRLSYTDDDAYQIYAFLKSPEGGALPDDQIRILIDESATKERIEETMKNVFNQADENDVIVLYFSGHGLKGSFLPIDYNGKENKLSHSTILQLLEESPAKYKLCVADACHSGSLTSTRSSTAVDKTIKDRKSVV